MNIKLRINTSELEVVRSMSRYNSNYYRFNRGIEVDGIMCEIIHEDCIEDYDYYEYTLGYIIDNKFIKVIEFEPGEEDTLKFNITV